MAWDTHPQSAGGWLYVLQPTIVMQARVNMASATYPTAEITYDGVTLGAYTDIEIGQTILIGSTAGAYDLGRTYLRAAPDADTLPIGYSSKGKNAGEVTLTDNAYITVVDTYEVWKKIQRVDDAGNWYKDYDLNGTTPPDPIMHVGDVGGVGRIGFSSAGVLAVTGFDYSGSTLVNTGETWVSRGWDMKDGTYTSGTSSSAAPDLTFPTGKRWILLYGEASGGGYTYRRYLVVALDPTSPDVVRFNNLRIKRTAEGQTLTADLHERLDPADYLPGTVVMYLAREKRGSVTTITQRFAGWLDVESSFAQARREFTDKGTTLVAVDVAGKLAQLSALGAAVENEAAQDTWLQMVGANPERFIHRYLAFETTALNLADWTLTGLTGSAAYPFMAFSTTGGRMYETCDGLARAFGRRLTCDSNGRLYLKADPLRQDSGDRTSTVQRHVGEADWGSIRWNKRTRPRIGVLRAQNTVISSGYASALLTPFPDVYSIAPGTAAGQGNGEQTTARGVGQSQTESNARAGHDYARAATLDDPYTIEIAHGVDADIEPANMTWVTVTATQGNAGYRGDTLTTARGLPLEIQISVDAQTGVSTQVMTWERETSGQTGEIDLRPTAAILTPPPPPPSTVRTVVSTDGLGLVNDLAVFCTSNKVHLIGKLLDLLAGGTPTVTSHSLSLTGTLAAFAVRADSYVAGSTTVDGYVATSRECRTISDIASARTIGTAHSFPLTTHSVLQVQLQTERGEPDVCIVARHEDTNGASASYTDDGGATWTAATGLPNHYDSNWINTQALWSTGLYLDPRGNGKALISAFTSTTPTLSGFWESSDGGATWSAVGTSGYTLTKYNARCVTRPLLRPDDVVFFGDAGTSPSLFSTLIRVIGTTRTDISPTVSGAAYGPWLTASQRAISGADDDANALFLVGYNWSNGKYGVWQTFDALATAPTWTTIVTPAAGVNYRGVYYVNTRLAFLYGDSGALAICVYQSGAWDIYEMTVSGAGNIVGLCGL